MNSNLFNRKFIVILIFIVFFYALILFVSDLEKIIFDISEIKLEYIAICFPIMMGSIIVTSWRYHIMLYKLNIKLNFKESFLLFTAGLSMLITPGASGSIIKSYILKQKMNQSISSTTPIVLYEKWLELFSIVIVIGTLLFFTNFWEAKIVFIIGMIVTIFLFVLFKYSVGLNTINKLMSKIRFTQKLKINTEEFRHTTENLTNFKTFFQLLSLTLLTKLFVITSVFLVFQSLSLNFDIFSSGQIYFTSVLIGFLTMIPGGVVVTETSMLGLLLSNNIELSIASLTVFVVRGITLWFPMMIGFLALKIITGRKNIGTLQK